MRRPRSTPGDRAIRAGRARCRRRFRRQPEFVPPPRQRLPLRVRVTIHVVDEGYDTGSILAQRKIPVRADDNAESLAKRVLSVEHEIYVETIGKIVMGKISLMQS